jgi:hypothetical protein
MNKHSEKSSLGDVSKEGNTLLDIEVPSLHHYYTALLKAVYFPAARSRH